MQGENIQASLLKNLELDTGSGCNGKTVGISCLSRINHLPDHPVFREATSDLACLGVRVEADTFADAKPYAIITGRSNARWWFVPLESRKLATAGLALFQPTLASARCLKWAASAFAAFGIGRAWAKSKVFITGIPPVADYFPARMPLVFAYFTGTNSPHRKVAVQVMERGGKLMGFVKLTRNPEVRQLLSHETKTLNRVGLLSLESAYVPKVLYFGDYESVTLLATDTLKTSRTASTNTFTVAHQAFLQELAFKTSISEAISSGDIACIFRTRIDKLRSLLEMEWQHRLERSVERLEAYGDAQLKVGLTHGDFTPSNTFMVGRRLYVFDWEYAEDGLPFTNDVIHFCLNEPRTRRRNCRQKIEVIQTVLSQPWTGLNPQDIPIAITIYVLTISLRYLERSLSCEGTLSVWGDWVDTATLFEAL